MTHFRLLLTTNEKVCDTESSFDHHAALPTTVSFCTLTPFEDLRRNKNQKTAV